MGTTMRKPVITRPLPGRHAPVCRRGDAHDDAAAGTFTLRAFSGILLILMPGLALAPRFASRTNVYAQLTWPTRGLRGVAHRQSRGGPAHCV
jgi:hypothetical protein